MKLQHYSTNQDNLNNGSNGQADIKGQKVANFGPNKENKGFCKPAKQLN
jgi:hypothetical protein